MHRLGVAYDLLRQTWTEFSETKAMRLAAALAFYTALSLAPLLLLVLAIAGAAFGEEAARGELVHQLKDLTGSQGAEAAESLLAASRPKEGGLVAGIIAVVTLLVGATGVFAALQDALNTVWRVPEWKSPSGIWGLIKDRLLSFSMVCGMAFLLIASLVVSAVLNGVGGAVRGWFPGWEVAIGVTNFAVAFAVMMVMFAMIFKVLPYARPAWSDVWVGAAITAALFSVGKYLIGLYLGTAAVGSTFGAAGSFVVLLVWMYYSSIILLFGACFTRVYSIRYGTPVGKADALAGAGSPDNPAGRAGAAPALAYRR